MKSNRQVRAGREVGFFAGPRRPMDILARTAVVVALAVFAVWLWSGRLLPALGTDSLIYHLTIPAMWLEQGLLCNVDLPFHDGAAEHAPMLSEVICYFLMRLTGDDGLTWLVQPAFLIATFWLFYLSARLLGAGRNLAMAATALLVLFRPFWVSAQIVNNELVLTCGCAMFLYGLLRATGPSTTLGTGRPVIWAAAGIALMLATKTVGVVYGVVALVLLAPVIWRRLVRRGRVVELAAAAAILTAGAFFYLRNWITHGNPLFPAEVRIAGVTIFPGLYNTSALIDHGWSPALLLKMLVHDTATFSPTLPAGGLLWVGWAVFGVLTLAGRGGRRDWPKVAAGFLFPILSAGLFFAVTPFWQEHRLLFPVYYALWLGAAGALARLARLGGRRVATGITIAVLVLLPAQLYFHGFLGQTWVYAVAAVAAVVASVRLRKRIPARAVWLALAGVVVVVGVLAAVWYGDYRADRQALRGRLYERYYGPKGQAWNFVERLSRRRGGLTVAYAGSPIVFPLFGSELSNRVVYVPVSRDDRPGRIELRPGDSIYLRLAQARRRNFDERFWLEGIRRSGVELLYMVDEPTRGGVKAELGAIARHGEMFETLFQADGVTVFAVRTNYR